MRAARTLFRVPVVGAAVLQNGRQVAAVVDGSDQLDPAHVARSIVAMVSLDRDGVTVVDEASAEAVVGPARSAGLDVTTLTVCHSSTRAPDIVLLVYLMSHADAVGAPETGALMDLARLLGEAILAVESVNTDGTTGLLNRIGFERAAAQVLGDVEDNGQPVAVYFVTLDGARPWVNAGTDRTNDQILHAVGAEMQRVFGDEGVVARVGEGCFCALVPGVAEDATIHKLAEFTDDVHLWNRLADGTQDVKFSAGVLHFEFDQLPTVAALIAELDRRMHQQRRRRAELSRPERLANMLLDVADGLSAAESYDERMMLLCREVVRLLGCDRCSVFLRNDDFYHATFNYGNPPDIAARFPTFRFRSIHPLVRAAMGAQGAVVISDAHSSQLLAASIAEDVRMRSLVVCPLIDRHEDLGFITVEFNEQSGVFDDLDIALIEGLARIAATATRIYLSGER